MLLSGAIYKKTHSYLNIRNRDLIFRVRLTYFKWYSSKYYLLVNQTGVCTNTVHSRHSENSLASFRVQDLPHSGVLKGYI